MVRPILMAGELSLNYLSINSLSYYIHNEIAVLGGPEQHLISSQISLHTFLMNSFSLFVQCTFCIPYR